MIKQTILSLIAASGMLALTQASAHQSHHNGGHHWHQPSPPPKPMFDVNRAQANQAALINNGVKSRKLTRDEERKLRHQQAEIAKLEHHLRRGGLTHWELNTLKQRLMASKNLINAYLNNRNYRKPPRPHRPHHRNGHGHRGHHTWNHSSGRASFSITIGH